MNPEAFAPLIQTAIQAIEHAYCPYSKFPVGAALLSSDGRIFSGCNIENASFGATICAERTALAKAISEGVRDFERLVVVTENGSSPCGICRQALYEFSPDLDVILADTSGHIHHQISLKQLFSLGFSPKNLE